MGLTWVLGPILAAGGMPAMLGQSGGDIDFKISPAFLQQLASNNSVLTTLKVKLTHRTNRVHDLKGDCELHRAGTVFTYDYFSVVKTLRTAPKTNTVPWEDPDHDTDG